MGWLITLGILVLLAILPLGASIRYNSNGLSLKVITGPIRIGILPRQGKKAEKKDKPPKEKTPKKTVAKPAKPRTEEKKEKGGPIADFLPLVKVALDLLNSFRKKLRVDRLELKLILAGEDPCDLAVNYGKVWAAVGNLMPRLERFLIIKKRDVEVECDFETSEVLVIAHVDLTITLGRLLGLLAVYGFRAIKEYITLQNKRKGGKVT